MSNLNEKKFLLNRHEMNERTEVRCREWWNRGRVCNGSDKLQNELKLKMRL